MPGTMFISRHLPQDALDLARSRATVRLNPEDRRLSPDELGREIRDAEGLVCLLTDTIDEPLLARAGRLRVVANVAVGYNNIDVPAASRRRVVVTNTPGVLTETTADFTWALLLATARRVAEGDAYTRAGKFTEWGLMLLLGGDVHGKTLGILGLGRIGRAVARRAQGFAMRLLYHDAVRDPAAERDLGVVYQDKATVLREADFVTLHVPLLAETHHYIGEPELRRMKPTAFLINASRGPVVHEAALVRALKEGWIAGAGLDVYEEEPTVHAGLLECPNAVLAPHIASASRETRTKMAMMAVENCLAVLEGTRPPNPVNPEILT
ncbi:MAG TPA: D-glycerate dehydrogenase [Methylomirabilota bacterium]|jgi:lactate dehydrogenase-like 2-hydroxyacid dehydrogenase|nr:D-glycerate dehydrogenase [Methylomirabilota bacterium]